MIDTQIIQKLANSFHDNFTGNNIVLYAGANIPSQKMLGLLGSTLGAMPAMGYGPAKMQPGVGEISELEGITERLAIDLFNGGWAEVKFPSCTLANLAIYLSVCSPGDTVAVTPASAGGHISHQGHGAPAFNDLNVIDLAFNNSLQTIDDQRSAEIILQHRPKLVMLGASYTPFPYTFESILASAKEVSATVVYDVAHVAGLIGGGYFPNPLESGVDMISMSTYKSLGGPPGGIIVGRRDSVELETVIRSAAYPKMLANYDASRIAALAIALVDMRDYGKQYAKAMCDNAASLRNELVANDIQVLDTATHHLALPFTDTDHICRVLEEVGIISGTTSIAGQSSTHAIRLGTQLITRRGFAPRHMKSLANLIRKAIDQDDPKQVSDGVRALSKSFNSLHFVS